MKNLSGLLRRVSFNKNFGCDDDPSNLQNVTKYFNLMTYTLKLKIML